MRRTRWWLAPGLAALAVSAGVLLWPVNGNGVRGNALRPHYSGFGWFAYGPLPDDPTPDDLRAAGVVLPVDRVTQRRHVAESAGLAGVVLVVGGLAVRRRPTSGQPAAG